MSIVNGWTENITLINDTVTFEAGSYGSADDFIIIEVAEGSSLPQNLLLNPTSGSDEFYFGPGPSNLNLYTNQITSNDTLYLGQNYSFSYPEANNNYSHSIIDSNLVWTNGSDITITIDTLDSPDGSVTFYTGPDGSSSGEHSGFIPNGEIRAPEYVSFTPLSDGNMVAVLSTGLVP